MSNESIPNSNLDLNEDRKAPEGEPNTIVYYDEQGSPHTFKSTEELMEYRAQENDPANKR